MTENKKYNNSNLININPDINLSVNNEYKNIINTFDRENVTQNLKNNIDCLKNRSIERKFLTLSRESIENSILNKNLEEIQINKNKSQEVREPSNLNESFLTFANIKKNKNLKLSIKNREKKIYILRNR